MRQWGFYSQSWEGGTRIHESNMSRSSWIWCTQESCGGLMSRLTTPVDKNVRWRLPPKAITSWAAVGGDHEQKAWTHDQGMFCKPHWFLSDKKVWHFQWKEYLQKRDISHGDIMTWLEIIFSDNIMRLKIMTLSTMTFNNTHHNIERYYKKYN